MASNDITSISYTDKDFQTIYPELLNLAERISERWHPESSNESDPGVVLLKLMAIVADKNNYNIDKNILECFPSTVTQMANARKLFSQLGYDMHWYRSATGTANIAVKKTSMPDGATGVFNLPLFTEITGYDGKIVYTTLPYESRQIGVDGTVTSFDVIQGVVKEYQGTSGDGIVTIADIDSDNRIYLPSNRVAENGIFICSVRSDGALDETTYGQWQYRESLATENLNQTIYSFGVSEDGNNCYIQFPEDIDSLIGAGIGIKYTVTDDVSGNIKANYFYKFVNDITVDVQIDSDSSSSSESVTLNTDNTVITNPNAMVDGKSYESIEKAFVSYKKRIGTFDTLVTCRDYSNFVSRNKELASNGFVCDRTNDVSRGYNVITDDSGVIRRQNQTTRHTDTETGNIVDDMTAFQLTIYASLPMNVIDNASYDGTFKFYSDKADNVNQGIIGAIQDAQSAQHDFVSANAGDISAIINKYNIDCKIIPQYALTDVQTQEIKNNIIDALRTNLNANEVEFGEEVTIDRVYDIIYNADERIKNVILNNISFMPRAQKVGGDESAIANVQTQIKARCVLNGNTPFFNFNDKFNYGFVQKDTVSIDDVTKIKTLADININSTDEVQLETNESVILYKDNYISGTTYGNGVRYVSSAVANKDSVTDAGAYLFWKENDGDTEYQFVAIGGSDKYWTPSFDAQAYDNYSTISASISGRKSGTTRGLVVGDISLANYITNNVGSNTYGLSATNTITEKIKNQVTINSNDRIFFILNDEKADDGKRYWCLFDENSDSGNQTRYLQQGEFLIACDEQQSVVQIFGSGTKVEIANPVSSDIRIEVVDKNIYTQIVNSGVDIIFDKMIRPGKDITVTEEEMLVFGEGYKLSTTSNSLTSLPLNNTPAPCNDVTLSATYNGDTTEINTNGYYARSMLTFIASKDKPMIINRTEDRNSVVCSIVQDINSFISGSSKISCVPPVAGSVKLLNANGEQVDNADGEHPATVSDSGVITQTSFKSGKSSADVKKIAYEYKISGDYIQTDRPVSYSGSDSISTIGESDNKLSILAYNRNSDSDTDGVKISYTDYGVKISNTGDDEAYVDLSFGTNALFRVFSVYSDRDVDGIVYKYDTNYTKISYPMGYEPEEEGEEGEEGYDKLTGGVKKYYRILDANTQFTIPKDATIEISAVRTSSSSLLADSSVYPAIKSLDYNHIFNYMYEPTDEDFIDINYVTTGDQFMNTHHPYNKYTICQMNTDGINIEVFSKGVR